MFGDKERFVTAAYKRKLEEDKKWLEEEKLREQVEAAQDVRKRGHMGDFYRFANPPFCLESFEALPLEEGVSIVHLL